MTPVTIFMIVVILLALILVKSSLVIIPQSETKIIERLGKYYATLKPGINLIIPFIDRPKTIIAYEHGRYRTTNSIDIKREETFKGNTALGCECRRNSFPAFFTAMMRRISLTPPLEEPAHAPLNIIMAVGIQKGAPQPT